MLCTYAACVRCVHTRAGQPRKHISVARDVAHADAPGRKMAPRPLQNLFFFGALLKKTMDK
jgi:hypothetical protein